MKQYWPIVAGLVIFTGVLCAYGQARAQSPQQEKPPTAGAKQPRQAGQRKGRSQQPPDKLKFGDLAPDFTLKSLGGPEKVTLSDFRGKRPVVLVFGSYT